MFISISFCMLATFFFIQERHSPCPAVEARKDHVVTAETIDNLAWLPPASIVTFAVSYSMGMGPLPWVLNAELFSKKTKDSFIINLWLIKFYVTKAPPPHQVHGHGCLPCYSRLLHPRLSNSIRGNGVQDQP